MNTITTEQATTVLTAIGKRQMEAYQLTGESPTICPRCGKLTMRDNLILNSKSRRLDIYICPDCGTDEAIQDFAHTALPPEEWAILHSGSSHSEEGGEPA